MKKNKIAILVIRSDKEVDALVEGKFYNCGYLTQEELAHEVNELKDDAYNVVIHYQ